MLRCPAPASRMHRRLAQCRTSCSARPHLWLPSPTSRAARTRAPPRPAPATAPPVPPAVRHSVPRPSTTTHARRGPMSSSVLGPAGRFCGPTRVLPQAPRCDSLRSGKERDLLAFVVRWELTAFLRSGGAPSSAGTRRWPGRMSHRPTDAAATYLDRIPGAGHCPLGSYRIATAPEPNCSPAHRLQVTRSG